MVTTTATPIVEKACAHVPLTDADFFRVRCALHQYGGVYCRTLDEATAALTAIFDRAREPIRRHVASATARIYEAEPFHRTGWIYGIAWAQPVASPVKPPLVEALHVPCRNYQNVYPKLGVSLTAADALHVTGEYFYARHSGGAYCRTADEAEQLALHGLRDVGVPVRRIIRAPDGVAFETNPPQRGAWVTGIAFEMVPR